MYRLWKWLVDQRAKYRDLMNMSIVAIVAHMAYGVLNLSAIPPYVRERGWQLHIGVIYATFLVAETIMRGPMGALGDRIGRRPVYTAVGFVGAASAFSWTVIPFLWLILVIRAIDGAVSGGLWATTIVAMGGTLKKEARTTAMGVFIVTFVSGIALGPIIGGFVNEAAGSKRASFYVASALFFIAAVLSNFLLPLRMQEEEQKEEQQEKPREKTRSLFAGVWLGMRSIPDYIAMAIVLFFPIGIVIPISKYFAMDELHMTEVQYGLMFLCGGLLLAVVSVGSGRLTKIWGRVYSIHLGIAIAAGMMYTIALVHVFWVIVIFAAVIGLGFVIALPAWLALVSDMAAPEVRGSVMGALGAGQGIGLILGEALGGYLYSRFPIQILGVRLASHFTPFLISAFGLSAAFLLSLLFVKENPQRHITEEDLNKPLFGRR